MLPSAPECGLNSMHDAMGSSRGRQSLFKCCWCPHRACSDPGRNPVPLPELCSRHLRTDHLQVSQQVTGRCWWTLNGSSRFLATSQLPPRDPTAYFCLKPRRRPCCSFSRKTRWKKPEKKLSRYQALGSDCQQAVEGGERPASATEAAVRGL